MKKHLLFALLFLATNFVLAKNSSLQNKFQQTANASSDTLQNADMFGFSYLNVYFSYLDFNSIQWSAKASCNNKYYELERSTDSIHFYSVATMPCSAKATDNQIYNILDNIKGMNATTFYYRLCQKYNDDSVSYSPMVALPKNGNVLSNSFTCADHFKDQLVVNLHSANDENVSFSLLTASGETVMQKEIAVSKGISVFSFKMTSLSQGNYVIKINMGAKDYAQNIIKI
jgi:hypothetical protein